MVGGWDLASPSIAWISAHVDNNNLAAVDECQASNMANVFPSMMANSKLLGRPRWQMVRVAL